VNRSANIVKSHDGKIDEVRYRDADPEIASHVRRLVTVGLLPVGVGLRILTLADARGTKR